MPDITEIEVWKAIRKAFTQRNLRVFVGAFEKFCVGRYEGEYLHGMCDCLNAICSYLYVPKYIKDSVSAKIEIGVLSGDAKAYPYMFSRDRKGAKRRVKFCTNQIRKLQKLQK